MENLPIVVFIPVEEEEERVDAVCLPHKYSNAHFTLQLFYNLSSLCENETEKIDTLGLFKSFFFSFSCVAS